MHFYILKTKDWGGYVTVETPNPLLVGDVVIVETKEGSLESAIVAEPAEKNGHRKQPFPEASVLEQVKLQRKANLNDLKTIADYRKKREEAVRICHEEIKKAGLPMKVVGTAYSLDGGSITFAFIADGRVDFRDLVKNLSRRFQRSIRLHQIGARDESRQRGGYGICGREFCCVKLKGNLPSITSEMAKIQHIAHRGSERISGACGRLMCCLAFEAEQYREILNEYPQIGDEVTHKDRKAVVKGINILSGEIDLEQEDKTILTVKKEEIQ